MKNRICETSQANFVTALQTAVLTTVIGLGATSTAVAETYDVASTFPKNMIFAGESAEHLAKLIENATGGDVTLNIHGAGDLVPAFEVLNAVSSGAVPMGWDFMGYWGGTIPVAGLVGALPFGPGPDVINGWMWDGGGHELLTRAYGEIDVMPLPCHITSPEPGGWFNTEINTPEDLRGLKMRIAGMGGKVMERLGASTQQIPAGEIYVALERGRIDATEFSLPVIDNTLGFQEIAKYYYYPGWHQPSTWQTLLVNLEVWEGFEPSTQEAIMTACTANVNWTLATAPAAQGAQIQTFVKENGTQVRRFPDAVLEALHAASIDVIAEEVARDAYVAEAYQSIQDYAAKAQFWKDIQTLPTFDDK